MKVNYGKFGDLLAEVKAVAGGKDEGVNSRAKGMSVLRYRTKPGESR